MQACSQGAQLAAARESTSLPGPGGGPRPPAARTPLRCSKWPGRYPPRLAPKPPRRWAQAASRLAASSPRATAVSQRRSGRPVLRASRSRRRRAASRPVSTAASGTSPRSASRSWCAPRCRIRRLSIPAASRPEVGARWTAMSHSTGARMSAASQPASTGPPGRRSRTATRARRSPTQACSGWSTQARWGMSRPASRRCSRSSVSPSRRARMPAAARLVLRDASSRSRPAGSRWRIDAATRR